MRRLPLALLALLPLDAPRPLAAQAPAYAAEALACARFAESVRGEVHSAYGSVRRAETVGREGVLVVRARRDSAGIALEAWYDSLAVFRAGPEGREAPSAEGILGGRYRGTLDPDGEFLQSAAPFVPAGLRDVFDFSRVFLHFFPPLPVRTLMPGEAWSDGAGLTVRRLADSAGNATAVERYGWTRREVWEEAVPVGDSSVVVRRDDREEGVLAWRPGAGPLGWSSAVTARADFPGGAGRSEVTQRIRVRRLGGGCPGS